MKFLLRKNNESSSRNTSQLKSFSVSTLIVTSWTLQYIENSLTSTNQSSTSINSSILFETYLFSPKIDKSINDKIRLTNSKIEFENIVFANVKKLINQHENIILGTTNESSSSTNEVQSSRTSFREFFFKIFAIRKMSKIFLIQFVFSPINFFESNFAEIQKFFIFEIHEFFIFFSVHWFFIFFFTGFVHFVFFICLSFDFAISFVAISFFFFHRSSWIENRVIKSNTLFTKIQFKTFKLNFIQINWPRLKIQKLRNSKFSQSAQSISSFFNSDLTQTFNITSFIMSGTEKFSNVETNSNNSKSKSANRTLSQKNVQNIIMFMFTMFKKNIREKNFINTIFRKQFRVIDLNFFDFKLNESYDSGDVVQINKNTYYRDVYFFVKRIKNIVTIIEIEKMKINFSNCFRKIVQIWYIEKLFEFKKKALRSLNENVEKWCNILILKIQTINVFSPSSFHHETIYLKWHTESEKYIEFRISDYETREKNEYK